MKPLRVIGSMVLIFMTLGFRIIPYVKPWAVAKSDPTIWVRTCTELLNYTFDQPFLPENDPLQGSFLTFDTVLNSIFNDFNGIENSFVRFARYPTDPLNPPSPGEGQSTFSLEKAKVRTIDVCVGSTGHIFSGGYSLPESDNEGHYTIHCQIQLADEVKRSPKNFIQTLTHEIGHCVGLDHPQETTHSIMSYFGVSRLQRDDKMGVLFQYPEHPEQSREENTLGLSCAPKNQ